MSDSLFKRLSPFFPELEMKFNFAYRLLHLNQIYYRKVIRIKTVEYKIKRTNAGG